MLWDTYCMVRLLMMLFRGRAVPTGMDGHKSMAVRRRPMRFRKPCWIELGRLMPVACRVVFLADRGFADTQLMRHLKQRGWHFRIRLRGKFQINHGA